MRNKYLLGINKDNELVFGEFEIRTWNGFKEFSASFDTVRPFNGNDIDLTDYYEDYIDCLDDKTILNLLKDNDCCPSELPSILAQECNDVRDALDCSLFPEVFYIDNEEWYFESSCCGQHDTTNTMKKYTNKKAYELLMKLWKNKHLKAITDAEENLLNEISGLLEKTNEESFITDFIKELKAM